MIRAAAPIALRYREKSLARPGLRHRVFRNLFYKPTALRTELIWEITGTTAELRIGKRQVASDQFQDTWADITLAQRLLDWSPSVALPSGIEATVEAARTELRRGGMRRVV